MFTISEISKSYGSKDLFSDVSLTINRTDRLGLVGPNGAGKTTLFKIVMGQEEPDSGMVTRQRGMTLGFLPQESAPAGEETVLELATATQEYDPNGNQDYDPSHFDGSKIAKAKRVLKGLSFRETDFDRAAKSLSGGWVMRAHLARLLVQEPDLMMLDEPTNHLDLETLIWFQSYLKNYPGGIVLISHDREFLNQTVTGIVEIRNGRIWTYTGNYDTFLEQRDAQETQQMAAFKNQQKEIERLMLFVERFRAKNSKAAQAQAKLKQIDRMDKVDAPEAAAKTVDFAFPQPEPSGHRVVQLKELHFAYGDHVIYEGIDFEATKGERIVLVGPNGAGKSTLLKLLGGVLEPGQGERILGYRVKCGYYAQYRTEMLDMNRTVLAEALDTDARVTELYIRSLLGCFLFRDDDVHKKVSVLSGGEKSRLALVKILLNPPNLLLMDEPTTHLDISSIDALVAALSEYTGTLVFISHDVHFIRALATKVLHVNAGALTPFAGDYDYYLTKSKADSARAGLTAGGGKDKAANAKPKDRGLKDARPVEAAKVTGKSHAHPVKGKPDPAVDLRRALIDQRKVVSDLERKIEQNEERQRTLTVELEKPATHTSPTKIIALTGQMREATAHIEKLTLEWEEAALKLAELEKGK
ncbi:MAG TPA: ABC-F family ATP-binding cassette domain-containing protein [Candidatus Limnocylindria bacterium]|jgi:ATP-binding cassette subfamily F protein 3|nr:ABC-F family ATP-binding cassette domain-containing protein [Candidatus Limnocylindria bacterium]